LLLYCGHKSTVFEVMFVHSVFDMLVLRTSDVFIICVPTLKMYRTIVLQLLYKDKKGKGHPITGHEGPKRGV
jgi:hypothetical protein